MSRVLPLLSATEVSEAKALLTAQGLRFEPGPDDLVGLYDEGQLVATGARSGCVLKMLAILPGYQGGEVLGELVTELIGRGLQAGEESFFIFTPPQNAPVFEQLNFQLLVADQAVALLEYGQGLRRYLQKYADWRSPGPNGGIVLNGNPFTLGHLHLVQTAAQAVSTLYLFVVREDRSVFPFAVRYELAKKATAHLRNVRVLETGRYAVSSGTFPSYFLKRCDDAALCQMRLDVRLFARGLAPYFAIHTRFVGQEPYCSTTAAYNQVMQAVCAEEGLGWVQIERLQGPEGAISATLVRKALSRGELSRVAPLVPPSTYAFLCSPQAEPILATLRAQPQLEPSDANPT